MECYFCVMGMVMIVEGPHNFISPNKMRQVVMNYLDNAVYYSPESKTITVRLYKNEGAVVLEVIDRGMGVPKGVQKRLFTKFFRAKNAQKQRPDGTGIGLYLAKMVITGHGGRGKSLTNAEKICCEMLGEKNGPAKQKTLRRAIF